MRKISLQDAEQKLKQKHNDTIEMINYIIISERADFRCKNCGNIWNTYASDVINTGYGCSVCSHKSAGEKRSISEDEIKRRIFLIHGNNVELLEHHYGKEKSRFICNMCGKKKRSK